MPIDVTARFDFVLPEPTDLLLQFEAALLPEQAILASETLIPNAAEFTRVPAQDGIGERIWARAQGRPFISIAANGPFAISYVDASADPRTKKPKAK